MASVAVACGQEPSEPVCPKHVRVYVYDGGGGPNIAFDHARICADECVVVDRTCNVLEGGVVSSICSDGIRVTLSVKSFYTVVTLSVMDDTGAVVYSDQYNGGAPPPTSASCPALDVAFGFNWANGGGGAVGDASL